MHKGESGDSPQSCIAEIIFFIVGYTALQLFVYFLASCSFLIFSWFSHISFPWAIGANNVSFSLLILFELCFLLLRLKSIFTNTYFYANNHSPLVLQGRFSWYVNSCFKNLFIICILKFWLQTLWPYVVLHTSTVVERISRGKCSEESKKVQTVWG